MDEKKYLTSVSVGADDDWSLVHKLSESDPLFDKKKNLLEALGFDLNGQISCTASLNSVLEVMLQRARIIHSDEAELYFAGDNELHQVGFFSPRNELEALHSILSVIDQSLSSGKCLRMNTLQELRNATLDMIYDFGDKVREKMKYAANSSCDKEKSLLYWGESNGVMSKLEVTYIEGAGRGLIAKENLKVGDIALEIPLSIVISEELAHESDVSHVLENIDGISPETMLLLWSMKERHDLNSKFKLYFDALPKNFNTGLSFEIGAIMALDGTLLLEEIVQAKEHLRSQYNELFPVLSNDYPDIFPPGMYTWEQFLWACELWYSNSMKVMFTDGKIRTCLIPVAGFLNHSISPHILHYGKIDTVTNCLKFPLSRPCNAGEECFLSYGNFSSSHFVTFYGFLPQGDNPYDVIPLDIDFEQVDSSEKSRTASIWTSHMVRGTWLSQNHGIFYYGLPTPLLDHFRKAQNPLRQTCVLTRENLEIELDILRGLQSTFEDMLDTLGSVELDERENADWDIKLALDFKDLQRRIVSSIVASCDSGCKLVEFELIKLTA